MVNLNNSLLASKDPDFVFEELISCADPLNYYQALYYCSTMSDLSEAGNDILFLLDKLKDFFICIHLIQERNRKTAIQNELLKLYQECDYKPDDSVKIPPQIEKLRLELRARKQLSA